MTDESDLAADYPTLYLDTKFGEVKVTTTSATVVQRRGSVVDFKALALGQTIHAVGARISDGSIVAKMLQIKDDETGGAFVIEGSLGGLKGACPAFTFGVNGFSVVTDAATAWVPDPAPAACLELKNGMKVEVKGYRQADGSVKAEEITKKWRGPRTPAAPRPRRGVAHERRQHALEVSRSTRPSPGADPSRPSRPRRRRCP